MSQVQGDPSRMPLMPEKTALALRVGASVAGAIPGVGAIVQQVIMELIPNVRLERVERYLALLLQSIQPERLRKQLERPESMDVFEEGLIQSARALSDERRRYIATLVTNGISEDAEQRDARHFLRILNQLGDDQIIVLNSYQPRYQSFGNSASHDYRQRHRDVLGPFGREIGPQNKEGDKAAHKDGLEQHIASLGLLRVAEEDQNTDRVEYALAPQGRRFLRHIGLIQ